LTPPRLGKTAALSNVGGRERTGMYVDETFMSLLHDKAHWEFELFLMLIVDVILCGLLWPFVRKHWKHHIARDKQAGV